MIVRVFVVACSCAHSSKRHVGMLARGASADLKWCRRTKRALPSALPNAPSNESQIRFKRDGSRAELGRLHAQWLEHHTNADD
ncbi:unnamed protein product [Toxocara canis]|uniref:Secreted protein n=1 Tax=Toxocara canis TaxID=6265 RepID=A0A183U8U7_TOXCA|nr:unnamed protein product [Toxocara canis]